MPFQIMFTLVVGTLAFMMDLKCSRIDHRWTNIVLISGIVLNAMHYGYRGVIDSLLGMILPVVLLLALFYFHMIGAGDIKLFCMLGTVQGPKTVFFCILYAFLLGGIISLILMLYTGCFISRMQYLYKYICEYRRTGIKKPYLRGGVEQLENFHFTVPILMSIFLYAGGVY